MVIIRTITTRKGYTGKRPWKWEVLRLTGGGCTICTGTYGSGAGTGMGITRAERRVILLAHIPALTACFGVGRGASTRGSCVLPSAAATPPRSGAAMWGSGWCAHNKTRSVLLCSSSAAAARRAATRSRSPPRSRCGNAARGEQSPYGGGVCF